MKTIIALLLVLTATTVASQNLRVYKVTNGEENPKLEWYATGEDQKSYPFSVWRATLTGDTFDTIHTLSFIDKHIKDTVIYTVIDTTLTEKGIYRYYIALDTANGKTMLSPMVYGHNMGYVPAPYVVSMDVVSSKTRKAIDLSWKLSSHFSVRSLSLFRSSHAEKDFEKIAELSGDASSYTDPVPLSNHNYFYFILIADFFGYQQPSIPVPGFCLFEKKPYPPQNLKLYEVDNNIRLSWSNIENNLSGYQVYRSVGNNGFTPLHIMQTSNEKELFFADSSAGGISETGMIRYYVINFSDSYTESNPSDTVSVYFKKKELPLPPNQFDAIVLDDDRVKLIWERTNSKSVIGYNIYLTEPQKKQLNSELLPTHVNYFVNSTMHTTGLHSYAIESVGYDSLISEFKSIATVNFLKPYYHLVVNMVQIDKTAEFSWKAFSTDAIKSISLYRQEDEQAPVLLKQFENVDATYKDNNLTEDKSYYYIFYGEMENGEKVLLNDNLSVNL